MRGSRNNTQMGKQLTKQDMVNLNVELSETELNICDLCGEKVKWYQRKFRGIGEPYHLECFNKYLEKKNYVLSVIQRLVDGIISLIRLSLKLKERLCTMS